MNVETYMKRAIMKKAIIKKVIMNKAMNIDGPILVNKAVKAIG
jgi:hypothetical protein